MDAKTKTLLTTLTIFTFLASYAITFSCAGQQQGQTLAGQAYSYQENACILCTEYCGNTHTQTGGTILSTSSSPIKALEEGCTGEFSWAIDNTDVKFCCK